MVCRRKKIRWEKSFPDLDETWTHWWIEGDGNLLAVINGSKLLEAIKIVEEHFEKYVSIYVNRARLDFDGQLIPQRGRYEISHNWDLERKRLELSKAIDPNNPINLTGL